MRWILVLSLFTSFAQAAESLQCQSAVEAELAQNQAGDFSHPTIDRAEITKDEYVKAVQYLAKMEAKWNLITEEERQEYYKTRSKYFSYQESQLTSKFGPDFQPTDQVNFDKLVSFDSYGDKAWKLNVFTTGNRVSAYTVIPKRDREIYTTYVLSPDCRIEKILFDFVLGYDNGARMITSAKISYQTCEVIEAAVKRDPLIMTNQEKSINFLRKYNSMFGYEEKYTEKVMKKVIEVCAKNVFFKSYPEIIPKTEPIILKN